MQPPRITASPAQPLHGRVVLVTGGAQGIGRGIAQAALGAGARVMIADCDARAGHACLDEWQVGELAAFVETDVADEPSVRDMVDVTLERFGALDGLVNNAGIADPYTAPIEQLERSAWERRIAVDLTSAFLCCKHAFPALRANAGAVINIASTRALQSEAHSEAYAAAKGGLVALTHALAISGGPEVRVNCISPGWIETAAWKAPSRRHPPELSDGDHRQHPAGRVGTPEDIGALAVWLLSPAAEFMTGQHLVIDGGMTRKMQYT